MNQRVGIARNAAQSFWQKEQVEEEDTVESEKAKSLDLAISQIEKQFGRGAIMKLGERGARVAAPTIASGSLGLDMALGIGGVPRGRVVEIFGPEASGKTTLALHVLAQAQKEGGVGAFIDAEHALDPIYSGRLGVDIDNLLVSQPDTGEQALEIVEVLVRSGAVDAVVVDSVAALVPKAEIEGEMGDSHVGLRARLMSQALRKLTGVISKSHTCVLFVNQIRQKIGVLFGNPETTPGGLALKFHASVRMDIRKIGILKSGDSIYGNRVRVKIVKNKLAPPFRVTEFDIIYGEGISREGELIDLGTELGLVKKSGTWFSYGEERIGQGKENCRLHLKENKELADRIAEEIVTKIKPNEDNQDRAAEAKQEKVLNLD
jgi:recombination protein RecA